MGRWWRWLSAAVLVGALLATAGAGALIGAMAEIRVGWALLSALATAVLVLLGGLNVWLLLRKLSEVRFRDFLPAYLASWAVGLVIPGQLGDASQIVFLREQGVPAMRSGAAYAVDKALSFLFLATVAAVGASHYLLAVSGPALWIVPVVLVSVVFFLLGLVRRIRPPSSELLRPIHARVVEFCNHASSLRTQRAALLGNFGLTCAKWVVLSACYWCAFRAFNQIVPIRAAATIPSVSTMVGYIPVSIGGIGTVEWSAAYLFSHEQVSAATVVVTYFFLRLIQYLLAGGSVLWLQSRSLRGTVRGRR
jgi:uncharacterized protein (TIRG00374 family)